MPTLQWFSPITRGPSDWPPALHPRWIHDLLVLWRRRHPFGLLLEQAMDYTAQEIAHPAPRKLTLLWLADMFIETRGRGLARFTLTQSVWAAYSHTFDPLELAPAYLAHIIQQQPLARRLSAELARACLTAQRMDPAQLRRLAAAQQMRMTLGTAVAWLDTLRTWGILTATQRQYAARGPLDVSPDIFPLLVWIWWREHRQAVIGLDEFAASPLFAWFNAETFAAGWAEQEGRVWHLAPVQGRAAAHLHVHDGAGFRRTLLNLLSTLGRDNRQQPRRGRPDPLPPEEESRTLDPDTRY